MNAQHGPRWAAHPGNQHPDNTYTYVTTACGIENLSYAKIHSDVRELTDVGEDRATDAPICKRCAKIVGIEAES